MKKGRLLFLTLSVLIFFFLLAGGVTVYYSFASPIIAQVHIRPSVQTLQNASTLTVVPGHSDGAQQQVAGARLLSATSKQTAAQAATGQGSTPATTASGTLAMSKAIVYEPGVQGLEVFAGTTLTGTNNITVVTDKTVWMCICNPGYVYIPAHVSSPGAFGNMPVDAFHVNETGLTIQGEEWSASFINSAAFTGGKNNAPYTFVQQKDITAGEQALQPTAKQHALAALNAQVATGEQWVSAPTCATNPTADGTPGEQTQSFHVTVSVTCSGEVYSSQVVQDAAAQALTSIANTQLGNAYQLRGAVSTTIIGIQVTDKHQGTLAIAFTSVGTWAYHFTNTQQKHLAQIISGKNVTDAQKLLLQQTGVRQATITLAHTFWIWNTMPTNLDNINITPSS